MNNRRKDLLNNTKTTPVSESVTENGVVYVPPEKLEGLDKEVELDPEEEFQVDESNHGLYLLNYSDTENVTQNINLNKTTSSNEVSDNITNIVTTTPISSQLKEVTTEIQNVSTEEKPETNTIANSTDAKNTKLIKVENEKDKENHTLFMSDEIYNHFRPLESELPAEDMAPFIFFGQKLGGQIINDNLTNSPSLSASTKSVNFILAPTEKRKFNSRYSATEKYRNTSADEEEINEDMDVSVVKNIIEKNKIRNTVKGPAPARHVGLVNAYKKYSSTTQATTKAQNIAQLNVTDPIIQNVTPSTLDKTKDSNRTNSTTLAKDVVNKTNVTQLSKDISLSNKTTTPAPRNFTRNYYNIRRRPARVTASSSTENPFVAVNTTTEKASTSVYTAVVTSVSITSSMKGKNLTDSLNKDDNSTVAESIETKTNVTTPKAIVLNDTDTTTQSIATQSPSTTTTTAPTTTTARPQRHRIRIRTTTTESSINASPSPNPVTYKPPDLPQASELSTRNTELKREPTKLPERLANLYRQNAYDNSTGTAIRPKNILRRRRPTTTTSTSTTTSTTPIPILSSSDTTPLLSLPPSTSPIPPSTIQTQVTETIETTFKPFIVTSRTSSESKSKPVLIPKDFTTSNESTPTVNTTKDDVDEDPITQNEEVVIEAEKTYTASYVLAGLGFLPVAAIIIFVLRNVLNKKTKELDTEYEGYFDDGDIKKESQITPVARPPLPTPTMPDQKWEFPRNKLRLQTLLGQGNFGQVWKAEADDLSGHDGLTRLVAVKSIKETASQKEKQELLHEIYIMQKIGTHPNVVTLLACCTEQEPYLLIMEYVMCGKLLTYLRERRSRPDRFSGSGALTSRDLTVFAYCVARGMDYIASKGIVHRDLAARNVLVDHNKLCKIADFGMSRCAGAAARAARSALPVRWMAPEALLYNVYSHHTDVWAFGILLWEIVTLGSTPYAAMSGREVLAAVTEGYRLERPPHCKPQLYRAMHSCWHADPSQRPTFAALKAQLAELLDNEPSEGNYVDLDSFYQESSVYSDPSAIINDDEGLSAEYDRERRVFRE
ncbi:ephrin type-A receptor 2-like isoform X4 [Ostrinia furnacalis]|nr:ephrin type-A receptor 2-like isoform X4 [Ostrinia furnacalis]